MSELCLRPLRLLSAIALKGTAIDLWLSDRRPFSDLRSGKGMVPVLLEASSWPVLCGSRRSRVRFSTMTWMEILLALPAVQDSIPVYASLKVVQSRKGDVGLATSKPTATGERRLKEEVMWAWHCAALAGMQCRVPPGSR